MIAFQNIKDFEEILVLDFVMRTSINFLLIYKVDVPQGFCKIRKISAILYFDARWRHQYFLRHFISYSSDFFFNFVIFLSKFLILKHTRKFGRNFRLKISQKKKKKHNSLGHGWCIKYRKLKIIHKEPSLVNYWNNTIRLNL